MEAPLQSILRCPYFSALSIRSLHVRLLLTLRVRPSSLPYLPYHLKHSAFPLTNNSAPWANSFFTQPTYAPGRSSLHMTSLPRVVFSRPIAPVLLSDRPCIFTHYVDFLPNIGPKFRPTVGWKTHVL
nr:hypothetical protein Itr_chr15CG08540 [Ipomoea trifida]